MGLAAYEMPILVGCAGDIAHVVVMPNITIDKLEVFLAELIASRGRMAVAATKELAETARTLHSED